MYLKWNLAIKIIIVSKVITIHSELEFKRIKGMLDSILIHINTLIRIFHQQSKVFSKFMMKNNASIFSIICGEE